MDVIRLACFKIASRDSANTVTLRFALRRADFHTATLLPGVYNNTNTNIYNTAANADAT